MALSVVISVRDGAPFLERAVASVRGDAGPGCEIVVVDDRSADDTRAVAERLAGADPGICVLAADKGNPSGARNVGLAAAGGDVLAFLDVDDEWLPGRTAELARRLDADPALDVAYGLTEAVHDDPDDPLWSRVGYREGEVRFPLIGSGLYRRRAFDRIGPFDETLRFGEDFDWFLRAGEAGLGLVVIDRPVLRYHMHAGNMTRDRDRSGRAIAGVLRRSLQRRRRAGSVLPLPQPSDYLEARAVP